MKFAKVIIDIAYNKLDHPFTYKIPAAMEESVQTGSVVIVPFGRGNTRRKGYVIEITDQPDLAPEMIKDILELPLAQSGFCEDDDGAFAVELAAWMKERYGSTMTTARRENRASP